MSRVLRDSFDATEVNVFFCSYIFYFYLSDMYDTYIYTSAYLRETRHSLKTITLIHIELSTNEWNVNGNDINLHYKVDFGCCKIHLRSYTWSTRVKNEATQMLRNPCSLHLLINDVSNLTLNAKHSYLRWVVWKISENWLTRLSGRSLGAVNPQIPFMQAMCVECWAFRMKSF